MHKKSSDCTSSRCGFNYWTVSTNGFRSSRRLIIHVRVLLIIHSQLIASFLILSLSLAFAIHFSFFSLPRCTLCVFAFVSSTVIVVNQAFNQARSVVAGGAEMQFSTFIKQRRNEPLISRGQQSSFAESFPASVVCETLKWKTGPPEDLFMLAINRRKDDCRAGQRK